MTDDQNRENIPDIADAGEQWEQLREQLGREYDALLDGVDDIRKIAKIAREAASAATEPTQAVAEVIENITTALNSFAIAIDDALPEWARGNAFKEFYNELEDLAPFINAEIQKRPGMEGKTIDDILDRLPFRVVYYAQRGEKAPETVAAAEEINVFVEIIQAARQAATIDAQNAGRALRLQRKENAIKKGAVMELRGGILPMFSAKTLRDAFAPSRISQMGELPAGAINKKTGRIEKPFEEGDLIPLPANNISYKTLWLLSAIMANSVTDYRKFLVSEGDIRFYVKGVLDQLEIETRISVNPQQIELDPSQKEIGKHARSRKTAGALYLEKQLAPLVTYIGTTDDGDRYAVLLYKGYELESDTMTICSPYLFQLWKMTQNAFAKRRQAANQRIAEGKKPLKPDLKPLELNTLFKRSTYKEDDTTLEIAVYITNVLIDAGKGARNTKIKYKTLIDNCPRLREQLEEIEKQPNTANGKRVNKTAHYNSALRKIARAYTLIMSPEKCDALKNFKFLEFSPTKPAKGYALPTIKTDDGKTEIDRDNINWERMEFVPPTKSALGGEIFIKWCRINPNDD